MAEMGGSRETNERHRLDVAHSARSYDASFYAPTHGRIPTTGQWIYRKGRRHTPWMFQASFRAPFPTPSHTLSQGTERPRYVTAPSEVVRGRTNTRKGTNGVSANGVTANFMFLDMGLLQRAH